MATMRVMVHKGTLSKRFEIEPDAKVSAVRQQLVREKFLNEEAEQNPSETWRFFVYRTQEINFNDAILSKGVEHLVPIDGLFGPGGQLYLTNTLKVKNPDLMGIGTDWFFDRFMSCRIRLNKDEASASAANRGKFEPMLLRSVMPTSTAVAGIYNNVVVCEQDSVITFDISSWGAAGFQYSIKPEAGATIADGLYITLDASPNRTAGASHRRYYDGSSAPARQIVVKSTGSLQIPSGQTVYYQRVTVKTMRVTSYKKNGRTYSSQAQPPGSLREDFFAGPQTQGRASVGVTPSDLARAEVIPGDSITPGTPHPGDESNQSFGGISDVIADSSPLGVIVLYFFVFKSKADADKVIGQINSPNPDVWDTPSNRLRDGTGLGLVKGARSDGESRSFALDPTARLNVIRKVLTDPPHSFMSDSDDFIHDDSPLDRSAEKLITLDVLLDDTRTLRIGHAGSIGGDDGVQRYNRMTDAERRALFENIQIRRGLTADEHGFKKTFKDLYEWKGALPTANMPRILTQLTKSLTFNEQTHSLETSGVQSGSISVTTPWGGGEANFKYAQSHSTNQSKVTQYMTERYLSNKVDLDIALRGLKVTDAFLKAVQDAVRDKRGDINGYQDLVNVLNEWGWYVPLQYTLGGVLYSTKQSETSKYSEVQKKSESFGASFKAAFKGIGGGAAYENASGSESGNSSSGEIEDTLIFQIGGKAGTNTDYAAWNDSLAQAITWNTTVIQRMTPSLMLLSGVDNAALTICVSLLQTFNSYPQVADLQRIIDVAGYERELTRLLNPFG